MIKKHLPDSFYNPVSIAGALIVALSFLTVIFLTIVDSITTHPAPYLGVIAYIVLPVPLILGLLLIPVGIIRERRRLRRGLPSGTLKLHLDFSDARQRRALLVFSFVTIVFLLFSAYGSYRAFEWTESVEFCGTTCHVVMEPEHTAYLNSPHARVRCVECHVGSGAGWYVRSKLSGAYQVYATLADVYPRPIPTPIQNLRPAQETCEQCHWPSHFAGDKAYVNTYFKSDEQNTRWTVALLMKIGGGSTDRSGPTSGIHWHMNIANEIQYVATDSMRQTIPWVRARNRSTGEVTVYQAAEGALSAEDLARSAVRSFDCIDCHNRPSHIYRPPVRIVDRSLAFGRISAELPMIRTAAIQAMVAPYSSHEAASDSIPLLMRAFYAEKFPAVLQDKATLLDQAIREVTGEYSKNFFPKMKVSWQAYPNNIGHMTDLGCFRCHDGKHVSASGKVITKDCNSCHTILYQGKDAVPSSLGAQGLPFEHPEDVGDAWKEMNCRECHTGQ